MKFLIKFEILTFMLLAIGYEEKIVMSFNILKKNKTKNAYLTTPEIISKYGYPAESHSVVTEDGYILELHRIPHGKNSNSSTKNFPIYIQHGFQGSSADFVILGPGKALSFLLVDAGYDVWLGNFRGNTYSRAHVSLTPKQNKFWDFSWHEFGVYDLPTAIDYVCKHTGSEKIIYLGYSMGTTSFFVMASSRPEYQNKIQEAVLLAAAAFMGKAPSPLRVLAPLLNALPPVDLIFDEQVGSQSKFYKAFVKLFCSKPKYLNVCVTFALLVAGIDYEQWPDNLTEDILNHIPAGTSVKTIIHFGQIAQTGKFKEFDYKLLGNKLHYGQFTAPDYKVSLIHTKIHIFEGVNDFFSTLKDIAIMRKKISSIHTVKIVNSTRFNHLDFFLAKDVKKLLYDRLLKVLDNIDSKGNPSKKML